MANGDLKVRRLEPTDDRSGFRSGNVDLDRFFLRYAGQNQFRHHIGTTYVIVDASGQIFGFATVSASEIAPEALHPVKRKRLPKYPIPVLRLARLAVDERAKGRGIGSALLRSVLVLAQQMAEDVGCAGVLVDAKSDAIAFYEKLGFLRLEAAAGELGDRPPTCLMFLELAQMPRPK
ncbi:MAG TPA: GNAT family N-acetyltransferase [Polyangiaceae bacterium]|nr:GNAT family N-acetyltransferase [Polyangiaceae bacterium]